MARIFFTGIQGMLINSPFHFGSYVTAASLISKLVISLDIALIDLARFACYYLFAKTRCFTKNLQNAVMGAFL